jgi:hypothetical protein
VDTQGSFTLSIFVPKVLGCLLRLFFIPTVFQLQYQTFSFSFFFLEAGLSTCVDVSRVICCKSTGLTDCLVPQTIFDFQVAVKVRTAPMIVIQIAERVRILASKL